MIFSKKAIFSIYIKFSFSLSLYNKIETISYGVLFITSKPKVIKISASFYSIYYLVNLFFAITSVKFFRLMGCISSNLQAKNMEVSPTRWRSDISRIFWVFWKYWSIIFMARKKVYSFFLYSDKTSIIQSIIFALKYFLILCFSN